ncbi:MAG TPA: hypothetical protein VF885_22130 [Arthrobacter sp.]
MSSINSLYLLTGMTGRSSGSERTMIVATVEMKFRSFWIALIALVPGGILTAMFYPLIDIWAILWIAIVEGAAFFLIERRTSDGLRLRTYEAMFDKKKSSLNTFYLCGQPIQVEGTPYGTIQQITAPVPRDKPDSIAAPFHNDFEAYAR